MQTVIEIGKRGSEHVDIDVPMPSVDLSGAFKPRSDHADGPLTIPSVGDNSGLITAEQSDSGQLTIPGVDRYIDGFFSKVKTSKVDHEIDGTLSPVEVWEMPLAGADKQTSDRLFTILRGFSLFSPFVFARKAGDTHTTMGMLSPLFDSIGEEMLPDLKVLALEKPMPIVKSGFSMLPSADMAVMLSGSAAGEDKGAHSHQGNGAEDYVNNSSALGAISLGRTTILDTEGQHQHHGYRRTSSLDAELSNRSAGNVYGVNGTRDIFPGFAMPLVFSPGQLNPGDTVYVPKALAERDEGYGVYWASEHYASRLKLGVSFENVYNAIGQQVVSSRLKSILEAA